MDKRPAKIFPRNLTARAAYQAAGNPVVTRLEDAVGNCYPGLEVDVRNFDRRFFPGLVFEFVGRDDNAAAYDEPNRYGAWLRYVDYLLDPELQSEAPEAKRLLIAIMLNAGTLGAHSDWYLEWVEQGGKRLSMREHNPDNPDYPLDGLYVWRLLRGLVPGALKIGLKRRCKEDNTEVVFDGWRRHFTDPVTGVISGAYLPGELLQSLCSPWQHDFRDCACMYWASNHPDAVFQELEPGELTLPNGEAADPRLANLRVDWLRSDRSRDVSAAAGNTIAKNRPYQFDHFQINQEWQSLNVVVHDREIGSVYVPPREVLANPFDTPGELVCELRDKLGPMEMALALEYLYARFSVLSPEEAEPSHWSTMKDDVTFIRNCLMIIATCEMQHLRWVNELLWMLYKAGFSASYAPVLQPAEKLPDGKGGWRDRALRRLTPDTLSVFIDIEHPSGFLDGAYARVIATLRSSKYPTHAVELAERIDSDGVDHYSRFRLVETALNAYKEAEPQLPYLRKLDVGTREQAAEALDIYEDILRDLSNGYKDYARDRLAEGAPFVNRARLKMNELLKVGEELAAGGIGIPFWSQQ
jgi:Ferritin-like